MKILTIWLFIVLGFIAIGIIAGVWMFISSNSDTRYGEAKALNDRLFYAIDDNGYLDKDILSGGDILKKAEISPEMMDNMGDFYFNISIYNENGSLKNSFVKGNADFEIYCRLNGKQFPKCYGREIVLLNPENPGEKLNIKIYSGANAKQD